MVAVPTVLGIASFRVYSVEVKMESLLAPDQLSVYTPLPQSYQLQFIAKQPGALESCVTSLRGVLLPYIQAVQGTCVSVKVGTVHLYHASHDVYHYLKDPPPGFLPRLGSIYMAGLVGMFVTRNGSRLKRLVVPLAFMSAGMSVCYPAQSVTLLKSTGKQLYAAGQWSTATVSSLLTTTSPSKDHASPPAKDPAPLTTEPEVVTVPKPESPAEEEEESPVPGPSPDPASLQPSPAPAAPPSDSEMVAAFVLASTPTIDPAKLPVPERTPSLGQTQTDTQPENPELSPDPSLMDFGQSEPEDADMYSTRS